MKLPSIRIDKFALFVIATIIAVVIILLYLASVIFKIKLSLPPLPQTSPGQRQAVSPDILFFTAPVYTINGKITQVSGNTIVVSFEGSSGLNYAPLLQPLSVATPTTAPTITSKTLTFRVTIPSSVPVSRNDLKTGATVTVTSTTDLRTTNPDAVIAQSVTVNSTSKPAVNSNVPIPYIPPPSVISH